MRHEIVVPHGTACACKHVPQPVWEGEHPCGSILWREGPAHVGNACMAQLSCGSPLFHDSSAAVAKLACSHGHGAPAFLSSFQCFPANGRQSFAFVLGSATCQRNSHGTCCLPPSTSVCGATTNLHPALIATLQARAAAGQQPPTPWPLPLQQQRLKAD
jgi:hypothetical protein